MFWIEETPYGEMYIEGDPEYTPEEAAEVEKRQQRIAQLTQELGSRRAAFKRMRELGEITWPKLSEIAEREKHTQES